MFFDAIGTPFDTAPVSMIDAVGYCAATLVFLSFCMKTLIPLRLIAITSNVAFIAYAAAAGLTPILMLHSALLPLNMSARSNRSEPSGGSGPRPTAGPSLRRSFPS